MLPPTGGPTLRRSDPEGAVRSPWARPEIRWGSAHAECRLPLVDTTTIRVDADTHARLRELSRASGRTLIEMVSEAAMACGAGASPFRRPRNRRTCNATGRHGSPIRLRPRRRRRPVAPVDDLWQVGFGPPYPGEPAAHGPPGARPAGDRRPGLPVRRRGAAGHGAPRAVSPPRSRGVGRHRLGADELRLVRTDPPGQPVNRNRLVHRPAAARRRRMGAAGGLPV